MRLFRLDPAHGSDFHRRTRVQANQTLRQVLQGPHLASLHVYVMRLAEFGVTLGSTHHNTSLEPPHSDHDHGGEFYDTNALCPISPFVHHKQQEAHVAQDESLPHRLDDGVEGGNHRDRNHQIHLHPRKLQLAPPRYSDAFDGL